MILVLHSRSQNAELALHLAPKATILVSDSNIVTRFPIFKTNAQLPQKSQNGSQKDIEGMMIKSIFMHGGRVLKKGDV